MDDIRDKIDELDRKILELLNERANCALEIGEQKKNSDAAFYVPERERAVLDKLRKNNTGPLPDSAIKAIYREVISGVRALEKSLSVAFLGPQTTFSHKAALRVFGAAAEYHPVATIVDVFTEVERKRIDYGVVPVESSMGGGVSDTLDSFLSSDVKIVNEVLLHVSQNLISASPIDAIKKVYSKDNAILQCRNWLKANLPHAELIEIASTAEGAHIAAEEEGAAAIASDLAAESYNLNVVASRIEDAHHNFTRFFVLGRQMVKSTGKDKTSILMSINDRPGALYGLLLPFSDADISLTRIESRPSRKKAWEYVFFIDFMGHIDDPNVKKTLEKISEFSHELKVLGSFPQGELEE